MGTRTRWAVPLILAAAIWLLPHAGFGPRSWGLLCLFAATVCALVTRPIPAGSLIIVVISLGMLLRLFTVQDALSGFSNVTVWLIVAAFLFARGLTQTRLGERIAYTIVRHLGRSPLRLGYSIVLADLMMAPLTPSNTARAGGILFPITLNVARVFGSEPGPTAVWMGAFLMKTLYQGDLVVSAMFLTATAPNPLVAEFVRQGANVRLSWTMWALAASVPGIVALTVVPYLVYRLFPPTISDTTPAQALADDHLRQMGPVTRGERLVIAIFSVVLLLWLASEWIGLSPTAIACLGVSLLLLVRVLDWKDILDEKGAWDALIWFGGLMMLAAQLEKAGFPKAFAHAAAGFVHGWTWLAALVALLIIYLYAHYAFASLVAHVTAMFPAFFAAVVGFGAPPLLAGMAFGVFSSLNASTTHYGTGPAPIVFGAGYLTQAQWWRIGFLMSLVHLAIWLPIGFLWWKVIGLW
ncbi:MAG TPA: DASS family sodium-coupled anion symporter [Vicinamibacterales bacterium]|nr:DASS family sodium-coupled anion symporter [Vicinamibacterales bacterium]